MMRPPAFSPPKVLRVCLCTRCSALDILRFSVNGCNVDTLVFAIPQMGENVSVKLRRHFCVHIRTQSVLWCLLTLRAKIMYVEPIRS